MSNIYTTTKTVSNTPKLIAELKELPLSGSIFNAFIIRGDELEAHYHEVLSQAQVDEIANHINTFVEVDVVQEAAKAYEQDTDEGFDLYRKMIVDINITSNGVGLNASLDESIRLYTGKDDVQTMTISLIDIRCMLKDKFIEYTLRALTTFLDSSIGFSQDQIDRYVGWIEAEIREKMAAAGTDQAVIDGTISALKTAPRGMV